MPLSPPQKLVRPKPDDSPRRVASLYQELRQLAYDRGPEAQLPTMQEMRDAYGVSQATITGALDLLERDEIIQRIPRYGVFVSRKLHYKTILVAMDTSYIEYSGASPFWGTLWELFLQEAQRRKETKSEEILFQFVKPELYSGRVPLPNNILRPLENRRIHGILSIGLDFDAISRFSGAEVPVVVFAGWGNWNVSLHFDPLIAVLVDKLVAQGCRKVMLWQPDNRPILHREDPSGELSPNTIRKKLFRDAMAKHGLPVADEEMQTFEHLAPGLVPDSYQKQGYQLIQEIFRERKRPRPDGILSTDDMMTDGALAAMHGLGLLPGKDVFIATHANKGSTVLFGYDEQLIIAEFDPAEIVSAMFAKLDILMAGHQPDDPTTLIEPRLRTQ